MNHTLNFKNYILFSLSNFVKGKKNMVVCRNIAKVNAKKMFLINNELM